MHQTLSNLKAQPENAIDWVDFKIIKVLQDDCRLSFQKVAAKVGVSVGTAYNRIKNLEAIGLIKRYTILINLEKLGLGLTAVIFVQALQGHLVEVEQEIAKASNVIAVYDVTGEYDMAAIAKFKDRGNLNVFIKSLTTMPYVKRTMTNVAITTLKEDFRVKLFDAFGE